MADGDPVPDAPDLTPELRAFLSSLPIDDFVRLMESIYPRRDEIEYRASRRSPSIARLAVAMAKAQAEFTTVEKHKDADIRGETQAGKQFAYKYRYADLAACLAAVRPALAKNGIALFQPVDLSRDGTVVVATTMLVHGESGEWISNDYVAPLESMKDARKIGSAATYARRYGLVSLLAIASSDEDDENDLQPRDGAQGVGRVEEHPNAPPSRPPGQQRSTQVPPAQREQGYVGRGNPVTAPAEQPRETSTVPFDQGTGAVGADAFWDAFLAEIGELDKMSTRGWAGEDVEEAWSTKIGAAKNRRELMQMTGWVTAATKAGQKSEFCGVIAGKLRSMWNARNEELKLEEQQKR